MLSAIESLRLTIDGMMERGFGPVVNVTSSAAKAPIAELGLSNGARAGLTGFGAGLARAVAGRGVTINNLLPGRFATDWLEANLRFQAARDGVDGAVVRERRVAQIAAGRLGRARGSLGGVFLCSVQAG